MLTIHDLTMQAAEAAGVVRGRLVSAWVRAVQRRRLDPLPSRPLVVVAVCLAAGCVTARWCAGVEVTTPGITAAVLWWLVAASSLGLWMLSRIPAAESCPGWAAECCRDIAVCAAAAVGGPMPGRSRGARLA